MIRAVLVDDEQPARERLRQLLAAHPDVEVVGEAEDGVQAAEQIAELQPDVVFLDIQMPGASGLDVAASLGARRPFVVFCTAFDQYAVDAFELSATDYLLKPVNRARLAAALDRIRLATGGAAISRSLAVGRRGEAGLPPTRFLARRGSRYKVVPLRRRGCLHLHRWRHPRDDVDRNAVDAADAGGARPTPRPRTLLPGVPHGAGASRREFVKPVPSPTVAGESVLANGQTVAGGAARLAGRDPMSWIRRNWQGVGAFERTGTLTQVSLIPTAYNPCHDSS